MVREKKGAENSRSDNPEPTDTALEAEEAHQGDASLDQEEREAVDTDPVKEQLAAAQTQAKDNYDRMLRVLAEFENYKKRMAREMDDHRKYAHERFARDLLTVIDNLERALKTATDGDEAGNHLVTGIEMILKELLKILETYSVKQIEALGKPFDPVFHQAMSQMPSANHPPNTVIEEFQKGYTIHDRLLRPSMVVVSKQVDTTDSQTLETTQENPDSGL